MAARSFAFSNYVGTPENLAEVLRAEAREQMKAFPQYGGTYFDGWKLGRLKRTIRTKLGLAGLSGDLVLYRDEPTRQVKITSNGAAWEGNLDRLLAEEGYLGEEEERALIAGDRVVLESGTILERVRSSTTFWSRRTAVATSVKITEIRPVTS